MAGVILPDREYSFFYTQKYQLRLAETSGDFHVQRGSNLTSSQSRERDEIPTLAGRVSCFTGGRLASTTLLDWSYAASTGSIKLCKSRNRVPS
jgi:hypothetical protein